MQKIEVTLSDDCFTSVYAALRKVKMPSFRASDLKVFDPSAPPAFYRGAPYPRAHDSLRLEWIVPDQDVEAAIEAIQDGLDDVGEGDAEVVVQAVVEARHLSPSVWTRRRKSR